MPTTRVNSISGATNLSPGPDRKAKGIRSKEGCLTCRIRRKKCDQGKHADSCESCRRLHIECLGYSRNRPEWLKGVKVEEFKRTIKRFLAENSPKSGVHARQDPSMPVPFLSFEGLRSRLNNVSSAAAPNSLDYGASGALEAFDELDSTDGSDDEKPRHYQLQPLKKEAPIIFKSPEPIEHAPASPEGSHTAEISVKENGPMSDDHFVEQPSASDRAPKEKHAAGKSSSGTTGSSQEDQDLSHYISHIFPVLHELAGFNLSAQELLTLGQREPTIRVTLISQAKHHQNRMKFLTSTDGPHHHATQKLCLDLAASSNAYVSALGALSPVFEKATRANDVDTLAVLYTLLHFGGIGELLTRHIARRGNQGSAGNGFLLELSCRWLAGSIARHTDLASALRRGSDRQRAVIQAAIHIDIYSSIALCRPPHFLDSYRASFRLGDLPTTVDSNGVQMAVPRLDDLMDIPAKTLLALAEMSAMASWKAEHLRNGTLSIMDLSRWAKRVEALLAPPSPESLMSLVPLSLNPKKPPQPTTPSMRSRQPSNGAPAGPPSPASAVEPSRMDPRPVSPASAVSPTITNPNPNTPTMTDIKSEGEGTKASPPAVLSTTAGQATKGTLPTSTSTSASTPTPTRAVINVDLEMTDSEVAEHPASKPSALERPAAAPTPIDQNQPHRPPYRRILPPATREVFRCAGRVFLHTILSGEHPRVHDIVQAVTDTCGALRDLGLSYLPPGSRPTQTSDLRFPVVRGLPFCIFIAGSMAGNMEQGMFLRSCLRPVIREIDMQTSDLLTAVLSERAGSGDAISWQSVMVKRGSRLVFM
ncbi:unnamed protein product [Rhizoctonia solani]|uniref:Zn(2)-C6 fungal-type domain-containing protein n=1 Tax=Rhizoctonia solani TaxID=456999 RepID=A0A8H2XT85_9AGAM|nr:unnamed protein product [Rhizoctonia solani]